MDLSRAAARSDGGAALAVSRGTPAVSRSERRSEASRKAWATRKRRAIHAGVTGGARSLPAPNADGGFSVCEILARIRAAQERGQ